MCKWIKNHNKKIEKINYCNLYTISYRIIRYNIIKKNIMTTIANNRRKATNSVRTFQTKTATPTSGAELRKEIELTSAQEKRLEIFKSSNNQTERDIYMVYKSKSNLDLGKVCVETDTCPYLVIEDIVSLSNLTERDFFLPVHVIQNNNDWIKSIPKFENWLYSSCRYPKIAEDNKSILPNRHATQFKNCSKLDECELYTTAFIATLGEYFRTAQKKYAENCWKIISTLNYVLVNHNDDKSIDLNTLLEHKEKMRELIAKRDRAESDAILYKKFVDELNCSEYYWIMYNLMIESPESVHKSNLMNMDTLLMGLITQKSKSLMINEQNMGVTYDGIQDIALRMILERAMKKIPKLNCKEFVKIEDLVEFLHTNAGVSVQNSLRYWSFIIETIKLAVYENLSMNNFVSRLDILRNQIYSMKGIIPFCLLISPYSDKYLSDESIAEYILNVSQQSDKKFVVLNTEMLSTKLNTYPVLFSLINKNIERIKLMRTNIIINDTNHTSEDDVWHQFLTSVGCVKEPNLVHSGKSHIYKKWLIQLAQKDDPELLDHFINKGTKVYPPLLGYRKAVVLIIRSVSQKSKVFDKFATNSIISNYKSIMGGYQYSKNSSSKVLKDILCDISSIREYDAQDTNSEGIIEFVKFDKAKELIQIILQELHDKIIEIDKECPICFENIVELKPLHNDIRHGVCVSCSIKFDTCPFCRIPISINQSQSTYA